MTESIAFQLLRDAEESVRSAVLLNLRHMKWSTSHLFELAFRDSSRAVRMRAAQCCTDSSILQRSLSDPDWTVVATSLCNPLLSVTALTVALEQCFDQLYQAFHWFTASRIVMRHDLPAHWLERFADHPNATVRLWVATNPNTPRETVLQLARDRDWGVLSAMATLPDLPEEGYLRYAKHPEPLVRSALVANPASPDLPSSDSLPAASVREMLESLGTARWLDLSRK